MAQSSTDVRRESIRRIAGDPARAEPLKRHHETVSGSVAPSKAEEQIKVLEVSRRGNNIQELIREGQRESLAAAGIVTRVLDVTGQAPGPLNEMIVRAVEREGPAAIILKGGELLSLLQPLKVRVPFFFDHCTPYLFGAFSPLRTKLALMRSSLCYSTLAQSSLAVAGATRVSVVAGPKIPYVGLPYPDTTTVGVLKTAADATQTLAHIVHMKQQMGRDYRIVSAIKMKGVETLPSDIDVAEASTVIVAPTEFEDLGQPHEGAALALAVGRGLITTQTSAFAQVNFPVGTFIHVVKHSPNSYAAGVELFFNSTNQRRLLDWATTDRTFRDPIPGIIRGELEQSCA